MYQVDIGNGSHRPPPYVEWWYFHFACPDGTTLNMVLHETGIFGLHTTPYLSLSVHRPQQKPRYLRRELAAGSITTQARYLQVEQQLLVENDRRIGFQIAFEGDNCFRGEIDKQTEPLIIHDGVLYCNERNGRSSHWVVGVPHATFQAVLQLDGCTYPLEGFAYQDHQWGQTLFQEWVADWVWGHFSNAETAVVFFQILTQHGQRIERVAHLTPTSRLTGTAVNSNHLAFLQQQPALDQCQTNAVAQLPYNELAFAIHPNNLMRCRLQEPVGQHCASYLRWAATATLSSCSDQTLYGITEYIQLRPAYGRISSQQHH